jgi:predicted component of type VI protein secretion system
MTAHVILRVVEGPLIGEEFVLPDDGSCILGRARGCFPKLAGVGHWSISRLHCLLEVRDGEVTVRDLGSRNGTFVNGREIGRREPGRRAEELDGIVFPPCPLADGDELRVGDTVLRVCVVPQGITLRLEEAGSSCG